MKIIFAGTPEFAATALAAVIAAGHEVVAVLTQPDRPAGRGLQFPLPQRHRYRQGHPQGGRPAAGRRGPLSRSGCH